MKKTFTIIIPILTAMTLMSCGGGTATQNNGGNGADTTAANAAAGTDAINRVSTTTTDEYTGKGALPE